MKNTIKLLRTLNLPKCTLCSNTADPRMGILSKENLYYPLCDGCAPDLSDGADKINALVDRCKKSWKDPSQPLSCFGFNE